jgi:hypothetical protein
VSQYKFTVLKIMSRKNFCEFREFLLKGLTPLNSNQIQKQFTF